MPAASSRQIDGFTFDSKAEMEYYLYLMGLSKAGLVYVDVHPKLTMGPGDRVEIDFMVWYADGRVEFHDVKSTEPHRLSEFKRLQRRWRHPGGPLVGILKRKTWWERIEAGEPTRDPQVP